VQGSLIDPGAKELDDTKLKESQEKYCIICYELVGDNEATEIPTPSYEPDKFAHQDCFLTKLEELAFLHRGNYQTL